MKRRILSDKVPPLNKLPLSCAIRGGLPHKLHHTLSKPLLRKNNHGALKTASTQKLFMTVNKRMLKRNVRITAYLY